MEDQPLCFVGMEVIDRRDILCSTRVQLSSFFIFHCITCPNLKSMPTIHALLVLAALMMLLLHRTTVLATGNSQDVLGTGVLDGVRS